MLIRRIFCISVVLAIFLFSMVPAANPAGVSEWNEDGVAVCTAQGDQTRIRIVSDGAGGSIMVWIDKRSGPEHIYAQRLSASGKTLWGSDGVAVCTWKGDKYELTVEPDGMGGVIVAWSDAHLETTHYDIFAQRVDSNGNAMWSDQGTVVCKSNGRQYDPQVAADGYGGATIAWADERNTGSDIYAQHIDPAGLITWAVDGINICSAIGAQHEPAIVSDGAHGAIISWIDGRDGGDTYAQRLDMDGNLLWNPSGIAVCTTSGKQAELNMIEHDGGAIIAFTVENSINPDRILAQLINASGDVQWDSRGELMCVTEIGLSLADMVSDGQGGALICWLELLDYNDTWEKVIHMQRVDFLGDVMWGINGVGVDIATMSYDVGIADDGSGGAYVTWGDLDIGRVFAQHVDKVGSVLWFHSERVCGLESSQKSPQIVSDDAGGAIFAWEDKRSGTSLDVYAQSTDALKPQGPVWYLAEGCTAGGMDTWVLVQNPTESPVDIALDFQTDRGLVSGPRGTIPPLSRTSYYVGTYVTSYDVSTMVSAGPGFVVCERAMYGNNQAWAHDSIGVTEPARTWYLAEGCTAGGMQTWILVQNPGDAPVDVALDFQTGGGLVPGPRESLPANSRRSYDVGRYVTTYDVSTKVTASGDVVCERAMYGNNWTWAHDSIGATAPDMGWVMAEGCTGGGMQTWILVQNPGSATANIEMYFLTDAEVLAGPVESIPPGSRRSYNVGQYVSSYNVSTAVFCNSGEVICERAMYDSNWTWGHDSIGSRYSKSVWFLPEGCTDGGMDTYILVMNMSDQNTEMRMFFLTDKGITGGPSEVLPPFSRRTYYAGDYVTSFQVSTVVVADSPSIICERAMYGNGGAWAHCSIGY
jgi:hypothetical protein